jgi:hypothetical protein
VKASDTNSNLSVTDNDDFWTSEDEDFPKVVNPGDLTIQAWIAFSWNSNINFACAGKMEVE